MRDDIPDTREREIADLITRYYRRKIGILMQQAEHWDAKGFPIAVHYRLHAADTYYQVVHLFERMAEGNGNPFEEMASDLSREPIKPLGKYPPSKEMHDKYRDPRSSAFAQPVER